MSILSGTIQFRGRICYFVNLGTQIVDA